MFHTWNWIMKNGMDLDIQHFLPNNAIEIKNFLKQWKCKQKCPSNFFLETYTLMKYNEKCHMIPIMFKKLWNRKKSESKLINLHMLSSIIKQIKMLHLCKHIYYWKSDGIISIFFTFSLCFFKFRIEFKCEWIQKRGLV